MKSGEGICQLFSFVISRLMMDGGLAQVLYQVWQQLSGWASANKGGIAHLKDALNFCALS